MKNKILNFKEFIGETYGFINEAEGGIDESTIIKILDLQKEIAEKKTATSTFFKIAKESRDLYDKLSAEEKKKILDSFTDRAKKEGIDSDWIDKKLKKYKEESKVPYNPMIQITQKGELKKEEPEAPKETGPKKINLISDDSKDSFFKDNMWGYDSGRLGEIYQDPEEAKEIAENIKALIENDIKTEGKSILSVQINSSCSRYRNTGEASGLSWAELGFKRAQTFGTLFSETAKSLGAKQPYIDALMKKIKVDYLGSNGDGTSGPDPIGDVKKGYYVAEGGKSVWKDKKGTDPLKIMVNPVTTNEKGEVSLKESAEEKTANNLEGTPLSQQPKGKSDYEGYKFTEVIVEVNASSFEPRSVSEREPEPKEMQKYDFRIKLYKKYDKPKTGGGLDFDLFKRGGSSKIKKFRKIPCPHF